MNPNLSEVDETEKCVSSEDDFTIVKSRNARKKKRQISLKGDSLVKNIEQYEMQQYLKKTKRYT